MSQNLSKADTLTDEKGIESANREHNSSELSKQSKKTFLDRHQLTVQIKACDEFLVKLDDYITTRVALAEQVM